MYSPPGCFDAARGHICKLRTCYRNYTLCQAVGWLGHFLRIFRARPANRLTLPVMATDEIWSPLLWREVKEVNYNMRWLLLLPAGERAVDGSLCAEFATATD